MVYLIGAGPGNPELITVKGLRLLQKCDAVIYDRLLSEELLSVVSENCHKIYVGKKPMSHAKKLLFLIWNANVKRSRKRLMKY